MNIHKIKIGILLSLTIITCIVWYIVFHRPHSGALTVAMLNIGQGDAIFVESPTGKQILIDSGPDTSVLRELSAVMPFYDKTIDLLIVTNPDRDHMAGFIPVIERFSIGAVLESGTTNDSEIYRTLEDSIDRHNVKKIVAERGMVFDIGGGASLTILFPDRDVHAIDRNPGSIVARLSYGATSYMLTGDSTQEVEEYLVSLDGDSLRSDILKVGHHGSRTSTGKMFLDKVKPAYALISAGEGNSYGHPHKETLEILKNAGIETYITFRDGRILTRSDGHIITFRLDK